MIDYSSFILDNGLRVYVHEDKTVPTAVLNIIYDVGSRDENEHKTGFAHLFEHLMFGGSKNISDYDTQLQKVGGTNNAFTSPDVTNYYLTLPANNIETGFWLESDRMLSLSFDPKVLEIQRKVVIEEFKQRYLNQPYGDVWLKLRPLAYKVHPYRWPTIGKEMEHIEQANMDDVKSFFYKYYVPNNAVLIVGGNVELEQIKQLSKKWFGAIPSGNKYMRNLPQEPNQTVSRELNIEADVPADAIYKVFHIGNKLSPNYHATDLLSDILGRGKSSRFYSRLVKEKQIFSSINAYISGSFDNGLFTISGRLQPKFSIQQGEAEINTVLQELMSERVPENELLKVKNQAETTITLSEMELLNRCMSLAYSVLLGNPDLVNHEGEKIQKVTPQDIQSVAQSTFIEGNTSTLYYKAKK